VARDRGFRVSVTYLAHFSKFVARKTLPRNYLPFNIVEFITAHHPVKFAIVTFF